MEHQGVEQIRARIRSGGWSGSTRWRDDRVALVLGCSLTFEQALVEAGRACSMPSAARRCRCSGPACRPSARSRSLSRPDYGEAVEVSADELPVFWACGVTPQAVVEAAKVPFCITHYPGAMLITDVKNADVALL